MVQAGIILELFGVDYGNSKETGTKEHYLWLEIDL
jgi:hypothetical protein